MGLYASKDYKSRRTSKLYDCKSSTNYNNVFCPWFFLLWNQSTVDNWGVSRRSSVAVGISDRWKMICGSWKATWDMLHVICDSWYVIHIYFFNKSSRKVKKISAKTDSHKNAKNCPKVQKIVKRQDFIVWCLYPHTPRELVSPVWGIFFYTNMIFPHVYPTKLVIFGNFEFATKQRKWQNTHNYLFFYIVFCLP